MTKIHEIDGVKYREVNRKAKLGDLVYVGLMDGEWAFVIAKVVDDDYACCVQLDKFINGENLLDISDDSQDRYRVLEPIEEPTAVSPKTTDDIIANIARRVNELERKLESEILVTDENVEELADRVTELERRLSNAESVTQNIDTEFDIRDEVIGNLNTHHARLNSRLTELERYTYEPTPVATNDEIDEAVGAFGAEKFDCSARPFKMSDLHGKTLRIYSATDREGDLEVTTTVGIDENGVMYVISNRAEVVR